MSFFEILAAIIGGSVIGGFLSGVLQKIIPLPKEPTEIRVSDGYRMSDKCLLACEKHFSNSEYNRGFKNPFTATRLARSSKNSFAAQQKPVS